MSSGGKQQRVIQRYRKQLHEGQSAAEQALERAYQQTLQAIQPQLNKLYQQMVDAVADGEQIPVSWLYEAQRLEILKQLITNQIDHFGALTKMTVGQLQHMAVSMGQQAAKDLLNASLPPGVNFAFGVPDPKAIMNIVGATQAGSPLSDLFEGFGREAAKLAGQALVNGITLGNSPRQIARDIERALGVSRNRALVISRTTMIDAYRQSNLETFRANSDVVDSWTWVCALLPRSCAACVAMNGTQHSLSESMDSHPCCMCVMAPKTKSWEDILGPLGIDTSGIEETSIQVQSGAEWFDEQSASVQQQVLGSKAAYDLYSSGRATLNDFVGWNHDEDWGRSIRQKPVKDLVKAGKR